MRRPCSTSSSPRASRSAAGSAARFSGTSRRCGCSPPTAWCTCCATPAPGGSCASSSRCRRAPSSPTCALQRAAYLFVMVDAVLLVLSGLVLWKSVQFPLLRELLGGYETARRVHFFAMAALVAFLAVHLAMVALVPRTLLAMIRGR